MSRYRKIDIVPIPISEDFVSPPPWKIGENIELDKAYVKFMKELQKTEWNINISK